MSYLICSFDRAPSVDKDRVLVCGWVIDIQTHFVKPWEDAVFRVQYFARSHKIRHRAHILTDAMGGQGHIFDLEIGERINLNHSQ
jgi:hypothetical protein